MSEMSSFIIGVLDHVYNELQCQNSRTIIQKEIEKQNQTNWSS
jgi:hypothetical protein